VGGQGSERREKNHEKGTLGQEKTQQKKARQAENNQGTQKESTARSNLLWNMHSVSDSTGII